MNFWFITFISFFVSDRFEFILSTVHQRRQKKVLAFAIVIMLARRVRDIRIVLRPPFYSVCSDKFYWLEVSIECHLYSMRIRGTASLDIKRGCSGEGKGAKFQDYCISTLSDNI